MPNILKILLVLVSFFGYHHLSAQNTSGNKTSATTTLPSDKLTGYTYDFAKAQAVIIERQMQPNESNKVAQSIIDSQDFPKLTLGSSPDKQYLDILTKWMEKNPTLLIESLKNRTDIVTPY